MSIKHEDLAIIFDGQVEKIAQYQDNGNVEGPYWLVLGEAWFYWLNEIKWYVPLEVTHGARQETGW